MMQISTPNAAYKIGSLVKKGYVEKIQSTVDRREYHLRPTQKYIDYYNISYSYLTPSSSECVSGSPQRTCDKLEQMLSVISTELMPELDIILAAVGLSDGAHDPGAASVLRPGHAGALQGLRSAQLLHDLCHERRDLFHHLFGGASGRGGQGLVHVLHYPAGSVLLGTADFPPEVTSIRRPWRLFWAKLLSPACSCPAVEAACQRCIWLCTGRGGQLRTG